jgi:hypothetical protein
VPQNFQWRRAEKDESSFDHQGKPCKWVQVVVAGASEPPTTGGAKRAASTELEPVEPNKKKPRVAAQPEKMQASAQPQPNSKQKTTTRAASAPPPPPQPEKTKPRRSDPPPKKRHQADVSTKPQPAKKQLAGAAPVSRRPSGTSVRTSVADDSTPPASESHTLLPA